LQDVELGYRYAGKRVQWGATFYNMSYKNQLVLTGAINDVGAYNRVNIAESYRRGIELEAAWNINKQWFLSGNLALSENKIKEFTEYVDDYDTGSQVLIAHKNTDISFSPAAIASGILAFKPMSGLSLQWITKYVGKQFLDNTSSEDRGLDAFITCDARLNWTLEYPKQPKIDLGFQVNNIFSAFYTPNGYTYSGFSGGQRYDYNYYFPQAGINFLGMIRLNF
jgi:iron complex outermembrane receptor protein